MNSLNDLIFSSTEHKLHIILTNLLRIISKDSAFDEAKHLNKG